MELNLNQKALAALPAQPLTTSSNSGCALSLRRRAMASSPGGLRFKADPGRRSRALRRPPGAMACVRTPRRIDEPPASSPFPGAFLQPVRRQASGAAGVV